MANVNKAIDIADEIFRELGEPTSLSQASISLWLRTNIGQLNNAIKTGYTVVGDSLEISPEIGEEEKAIFKKLYLIHYYGQQFRTNSGAAAADSIVEISSDGARVRKVNKNELSKTFLSAKKSEEEELVKMIRGYKRFKFTPLHVAGDDTIESGSIEPFVRSDNSNR